MERHPGRVAIVLNALLLLGLVVILAIDRDVADRLTREDGAVEWLQAALFTAAAMFALGTARDRWRAGVSAVLEILIAAMLVGLIIGEVDLDRLVAGRKIISTRFLVDPSVSISWRVVALLAMAVPAVVLALYALVRRWDLLRAIRRAMAASWGRLFITGFVIFGVTELLEKPLGRIPGLPRYLLEETLELVAAVCFGVALYARWRLHQAEEKEHQGAEHRCAPGP
jgi:hypothetical protein